MNPAPDRPAKPPRVIDREAAWRERVRAEAEALAGAIDAVREHLTRMGMWPTTGTPRSDRVDAEVSADILAQLGRTVYIRSARDRREDRE